jgi:hypothetical protein
MHVKVLLRSPVRPGQSACAGGLVKPLALAGALRESGWGRPREWPAECAAAPLHRPRRFAFPCGNRLRPPLTAEPLCRLRSVIKGQAGACPDRTRAIPCMVREITGQASADTRPPSHGQGGNWLSLLSYPAAPREKKIVNFAGCNLGCSSPPFGPIQPSTALVDQRVGQGQERVGHGQGRLAAEGRDVVADRLLPRRAEATRV